MKIAEVCPSSWLAKFESQAPLVNTGQRVRVARTERNGFGANQIGMTGIVVKRKGFGMVLMRSDDGREFAVNARRLDWGERLTR